MSLYAFYIYVYPPKYISNYTPKDYGLDYEKVYFKTSDGLNLCGWLIVSPRKNVPTIICCHGYPFDKGNIMGLVKFLYPDYNLFLFDFRAMGESEGKFTTIGYNETKDVKAAINYLKIRGFRKFGALGFSLGAAALIMADEKDIKAIISDSSFSNLNSVMDLIFEHFGPFKWPLTNLIKMWTKLFLKIDMSNVSPLKQIKDIKTPIFFIHGENDTEIPVSHSRFLYNEASALNSDTELWIVKDANHGDAYFLYPEQYSRKVKSFLNKFLSLKPAPS